MSLPAKRTWLCACVISLFVLSMCVGHYSIDLAGALQNIWRYLSGQTTSLRTDAGVLLNIRLPRTLGSMAVGGALSMAGFSYQAVFRNRLASPDLLGVSTGCCVGAAACILLGASGLTVQLGAFVTGTLTVVLTYYVSKLFRSQRGISLLLAGVLVGGIMTSILGLFKYLADPETELPSIIYWTMGDVSSVSMRQLAYIIPPIAVSAVLLSLLGWKVNFFSVDEPVAISMGVDVRRLKLVCVAAATLLTASAVSAAGTISWVGLAVPQVVRIFFGESARRGLPASFLGGMVFLCAADIFGRCISTAEIPMSVLTGVPGVVLFVAAVHFSNRKRNRET